MSHLTNCFVGCISIFGLLMGCHKESHQTLDTSSVKGVDTPRSSMLPYGPDRVVTFFKPEDNAIFKVDDFKESDVRVKLTITPDDLKKGQIKCTITDCSIIVSKPLDVMIPVPVPLGLLNIEISAQSTESSGQVTNESKALTGDYRVNLYLAELDLGVGATMVKKDDDNDPKTELKKGIEDLKCSAKLRCILPFIYVEVGLNERGVIFRVNLGAGRQVFKYGTINRGIRDYSATIPYKKIPELVCKSGRDIYSYLKKTYPKGQFADETWQEIVNEQRAMCPKNTKNPCGT